MAEIKETQKNEFIVGHSPHIHAADSTPKIMFSVVIALIPALLGSFYFFGWRALWLTAIAVLFAIGTFLRSGIRSGVGYRRPD